MRNILVTFLIFAAVFAYRTTSPTPREYGAICSTLHLPQNCLDDVNIVIVDNSHELYSLSGGVIPEWGVGVAFPEAKTVLILNRGDLSDVRSVLIHELAHIALHKKLTGTTNDGEQSAVEIPRWFDEGVAQMLSGGLEVHRQAQLAWAVLWRNIIPLEALEYVNSFNSPKAQIAYAEAHDAVLFLSEFCELGALCDSIIEADDFKTGFAEAMDMSIHEFYAEWHKHLSTSYLPFVILGDQRFLWTFLAVFFLIFGVIKLFRQRRAMMQVRKSALEENENGFSEM